MIESAQTAPQATSRPKVLGPSSPRTKRKLILLEDNPAQDPEVIPSEEDSPITSVESIQPTVETVETPIKAIPISKVDPASLEIPSPVRDLVFLEIPSPSQEASDLLMLIDKCRHPILTAKKLRRP